MQEVIETETETETEVPSISASTQPLEPTRGDLYLKEMLPLPEGCTYLLAKQLWAADFYRVNYCTKYFVTGSVMPRTKISFSQFIEIRGEDRTIVWHRDNGSKLALNSATGKWESFSNET